jgi:hypothetical protein
MKGVVSAMDQLSASRSTREPAVGVVIPALNERQICRMFSRTFRPICIRSSWWTAARSTGPSRSHGNCCRPSTSSGRPARARFTATRLSASAPLTASVDGRGSSDPQGDALTNSWTDGNGAGWDSVSIGAATNPGSTNWISRTTVPISNAECPGQGGWISRPAPFALAVRLRSGRVP